MKEKFVINIGRQLGSGGKSIAQLVARQLDIPLYDKELINIAAQQSGLCPEFFEQVDEKPAKNMLATLIGYLRAPFAGDDAGLTNFLSNDALFKIQSDVIREVAARESCLFVGRCADYILRDHPRAVNVFITASAEDRIRRIGSRLGCSDAEARARMERGDARRAGYYDYYSSRTWGVASTYHLSIDSSVLGEEGTADFIVEFAARKLSWNN